MQKILQGNSKQILRDIEKESVHSIVTDPPYELGFMDRDWDESGIAFDENFWTEVKKVLRPGGYVLSFGGSRTHHRLMVAIENAGFEIKGCCMWLYNTGFPKSHDVSRGIDKELDMEDEREVIATEERYNEPSGLVKAGRGSEAREKITREITAPASMEAKKWDDWGTALKPAYEPIVMAQKPLSEDTIAENVLRHSVGAINIDGCRLPTEDDTQRKVGDRQTGTYDEVGGMFEKGEYEGMKAGGHEGGRWPTNLMLDERASVLLDNQGGKTKSKVREPTGGSQSSNRVAMGEVTTPDTSKRGYNDSGGISRYFYSPKPHSNEKNIGCEDNYHPTVKPIELISYLIRLVTPEDGKVMDPFLGSGTGAIAALLEDKKFVGIELDEEKAELSKKRVKHVKNNLEDVKRQIFGDPSNEITNKEKSIIDHDFWG